MCGSKVAARRLNNSASRHIRILGLAAILLHVSVVRVKKSCGALQLMGKRDATVRLRYLAPLTLAQHRKQTYVLAIKLDGPQQVLLEPSG